MVAKPESSGFLVYMSPEDFAERLTQLFGTGGQSAFASVSGLSRSQVSRYANGISPIPKLVAFVILLIAEFRTLGLPLPQPDAFRHLPEPKKKKRPRKR